MDELVAKEGGCREHERPDYRSHTNFGNTFSSTRASSWPSRVFKGAQRGSPPSSMHGFSAMHPKCILRRYRRRLFVQTSVRQAQTGELPLTIPKREEDIPSFGHFHSKDGKVQEICALSRQIVLNVWPGPLQRRSIHSS